ncbi:hypothetical protein CLV49_1155 [Labedella gwakjiensis]|uniref:Uncharacterized protein n=1 Tax=Labedella gwakjiensis TaxID=390269 RepID=A0A2P8GUA6_9MICO|nr:hypothetical protein [Labedella gwakjiensis]PSL37548.1 hypothetical protein CLV49_1155 [Labedella gwakjiensis]RUQ84848.1 hypothetical protein ELQ93_14810 [Labedella gwakjiensis]
MDRTTRTLFLIGSVLAIVGMGAQLIALLAEIRWLLLPATVLWISGGVVVLVASGRYIAGRR